MNTLNFQSLIQKVTGRNLIIDTNDIDIVNSKDYYVYVKLPLTGRGISFKWKAAMNDEKILRSFITAFCSKYREPNPDSYNYTYGGKEYKWNEKTDLEKEYAYSHHATHMYSKDMLMKQIEDNFSSPEMQNALLKYGFYPTEYGVGIFCFWATAPVLAAIEQMKNHLSKLSIPFTNEFSDARWVFRFKLGLTKNNHTAILNDF